MKLGRFLGTLLAVAGLAGCATPEDYDAAEPTRILMIGNSFSVCVMHDLPQVADAMALDVDITSLHLAGCSLRRHMDNVKREWNEDHKPYTKTRSIRGEMQPLEKVNLPDVLKGEERYDIITVQQVSHESWDPKSYTPYGDDLVKLIRECQPQAKIYVQETWSYTPFDRRLKQWGFGPDEMYARLHEAYAEFAKRNGLEIIPMGAAVQRWREARKVKYTDHSFGGDVIGGRSQRVEDQFKRRHDNTWELNSDPFHLNERGEYLQALVWIATLFHEDVMSCDFAPEKFSDTEVRMMKEIANEFK